MISFLSDIIVGLSAAFVAVVAFLGLKTWRKELAGRAKFEMARNIVRVVGKFEADFRSARHPVSWNGEFADRKRNENETEEEKQILDLWYVRSARLRPVVEDLQKLEELGWETEALLNEESSKQVLDAMRTLRGCYADLDSAVAAYFDTRHDEVVRGIQYKDQDWLRELRKQICSGVDDELSRKVAEAKNKLASVLKKYVK